MGNLLVDIMIMKLDINLIELLISMLGVKAQAQVLKIMFIYTMNNTLKKYYNGKEMDMLYNRRVR